MAVTIKDVAQLAGVSPSTVSRTVRGSTSISLKTQKKVKEAMEELGYTPSFSNSEEKKETSNILGIILPPSSKSVYDNSFFLKVIRGITEFANAHQCLTTTITGSTNEEILESVSKLEDSEFSTAFIVLFSKKEDTIVEHLIENSSHFVQIGHPSSSNIEATCVDNDNISATYEACQYLYSLGHKKIGFVGSPSNEIFSDYRRRGYNLFLSEHQLKMPEYCSVELKKNDTEGFSNIAQWIDLNNPDRPSAIITSDDIYALLIHQICAQIKIRIPEDLSLITFNNSLLTTLSMPQITAIDVNEWQLGSEAARLALLKLTTPDFLASKVLIPHKLIIRQSCAVILEQ